MQSSIILTSATRLALATLVVVPAAASAGVTAQWNMDEPSGAIMLDSSGNNNNGTLYDVLRSEAGYLFNGTTSKVNVPDSPTLDPGSSDFSYSVVVQTGKIPPVGGDYDLIRKGASSTEGGGYRVEIENSKGLGKGYCSMSDSTGKTLSVRGTTNVADGNLHTLTCSKTATGISLQIDALPLRTTAGTLGSIDSAKPLLLGVKAPKGTGPDQDWYYGILRSATLSIAALGNPSRAIRRPGGMIVRPGINPLPPQRGASPLINGPLRTPNAPGAPTTRGVPIRTAPVVISPPRG